MIAAMNWLHTQKITLLLLLLLAGSALGETPTGETPTPRPSIVRGLQLAYACALFTQQICLSGAR